MRYFLLLFLGGVRELGEWEVVCLSRRDLLFVLTQKVNKKVKADFTLSPNYGLFFPENQTPPNGRQTGFSYASSCAQNFPCLVCQTKNRPIASSAVKLGA